MIIQLSLKKKYHLKYPLGINMASSFLAKQREDMKQENCLFWRMYGLGSWEQVQKPSQPFYKC